MNDDLYKALMDEIDWLHALALIEESEQKFTSLKPRLKALLERLEARDDEYIERDEE
tara:strand:+ start:2221 stop:2391 length:171 start_codon:yes stop_codon:yes gene_type:complete